MTNTTATSLGERLLEAANGPLFHDTAEGALLREAASVLLKEGNQQDSLSRDHAPSITGGPLDRAATREASADLSAEREVIANKAREWAAYYTPHSDGWNTFILFAEWVEARS